LRDGWKEYLKYFLFFIVLAGIALGGMEVLKSAYKTQYPIMVVVSQSMIPTLGVGDFILVGQIEDFEAIVAEPQPEGEILVFIRPGASDEYIVHRAVEKFYMNGEWYFVTKGDNNSNEDGRPVNEGRVMGRVVGDIPVFGFFPLFIKTSGGFIFVAAAMALVFFADYLMPDKRLEKSGGKFPWYILLPYVAGPAILLYFMVAPENHLAYEYFALAAWYLGCIGTPLSFDDDDMGMMLWLYHFVLVMIPLACDIVWRETRITPSMWWADGGSTMPITWLLRAETPWFYEAFTQLLYLLLPGCVILFFLFIAKRRGIEPFASLSRRLRGGLG